MIASTHRVDLEGEKRYEQTYRSRWPSLRRVRQDGVVSGRGRHAVGLRPPLASASANNVPSFADSDLATRGDRRLSLWQFRSGGGCACPVEAFRMDSRLPVGR